MKLVLLKRLIVYLFWFLPDKAYIQLAYFVKMKKRLNLEKPQSFNEIINWLKLYDTNPLIYIVTDKIKVRELVKERIGEKVLVPILWYGDNPSEIPFDSLPDSFVIKCNEGSGKNLIVNGKSQVSKKHIIHQCRKWLKTTNYSFKFGREKGYKNTRKKIMIEEYLGEGTKLPVDYKFFMSNGDFLLLEFCYNRGFNKQRDVKIEYLDSNLKSLSSDTVFNKPANFQTMLKHATELSKGFSFIRVDFYSVNGKVYFGELTLYPSSGWKVFPNPNVDLDLGSKVTILNQMEG